MRVSGEGNRRYLFVVDGESVEADVLASLIERDQCIIDRADLDASAIATATEDEYTSIFVTPADGDGNQQAIIERLHETTPDTPLIIISTDDLPSLWNWATVTPNVHPLRYHPERTEDLIDRLERIGLERELQRSGQSRTTLCKHAAEVIVELSSEAEPIEAIERACSTLHDTDRFDTVWFAEYDEMTDTFVPQVSAGIETSYLAELPGSFTDNNASETVTYPIESDERTIGIVAMTPSDGLESVEYTYLHAIARVIERLFETPTTQAVEESQGENGTALQTYNQVVSHELRNHLQFITIELEESDIDEGELTRVRSRLKRLERLCDEVSLLARDELDEGDQTIVSLSDALATICSRFDSLEDADPSQITGEVKANPQMLEILLENLFRNVEEHAGDGAKVRVGLLDDGFFVEDTGNGIDEDSLDELFDWGSKIDDRSGFGLAIVKRVIDLHGWDVDLEESAEGGLRVEIHGVDVVKARA